MTRVVCPLCNTGFEAKITRERCALNCVNCGVAFNAAGFLSKEDFATPAPAPAPVEKAAVKSESVVTQAFSQRASTSTRTGGLPFMAESNGLPADVKKQIDAGNSQPVHELRDKLKEIRWKLHTKSSDGTPAAAEKPANGNGHVPAENVAVAAPEKRYAEVTVDGMRPPSAAPAEVKSETSAAPVAEQPKTQMADAKPKKPARRPLLEGTFGPYEIEGEIARGGVGAVFRAREKDGGRIVALKVLLEGPEAGESERERFQHECETAKALSLPGMVQVYAVGEIEGRPYMAMELVKGRSLDKVIPERILSVNDCLVLMKSVAETIGALHEAGYVHRDLKPGNILIDEFNSPKVADFGLVKSLDEITRLTASGLVCGTPAYMSPEQARGDGKAVDPRSDVWALGAVLYEMLTARPPFQAENALRLMLKITKEPPKPPRVLNLKVPQDVHHIVMKCLEKNGEKRYPNARALADDITRFLNGEPLDMPPQAHERVQKFIEGAAQNRRALIASGIGLAVLLMIAVIARTFLAPREANPLVERGYKTLGDPSMKESERLDTAERNFRDALALDSKNAKANLGLGLVLGCRGIDRQNQKMLDAKKVSEALNLTAQAGKLDPQLRGEACAQSARLYMWLGQHAEETQFREAAVEAAPANLKYREALGIAYWHVGKESGTSDFYKRAVAEFQSILNADSTYPKVREYIKQLREQFLVQQAGDAPAVRTAEIPQPRRSATARH